MSPFLCRITVSKDKWLKGAHKNAELGIVIQANGGRKLDKLLFTSSWLVLVCPPRHWSLCSKKQVQSYLTDF